MSLDVPMPHPKAETIILDQYRKLATIDGAFVWPPKGAVVQLGEPNRDAVVKDVRLLLTDSLASVRIEVFDRDEIVPREGDA
jgi:hypothetical protein